MKKHPEIRMLFACGHAYQFGFPQPEQKRLPASFFLPQYLQSVMSLLVALQTILANIRIALSSLFGR
jgi:hypothetical protein